MDLEERKTRKKAQRKKRVISQWRKARAKTWGNDKHEQGCRPIAWKVQIRGYFGMIWQRTARFNLHGLNELDLAWPADRNHIKGFFVLFFRGSQLTSDSFSWGAAVDQRCALCRRENQSAPRKARKMRRRGGREWNDKRKKSTFTFVADGRIRMYSARPHRAWHAASQSWAQLVENYKAKENIVSFLLHLSRFKSQIGGGDSVRKARKLSILSPVGSERRILRFR